MQPRVLPNKETTPEPDRTRRAVRPNDYRIVAARRLIISKRVYTRMREAVSDAAPGKAIHFLGRRELRLIELSDSTVVWAAKRSNCFHGMSPQDVYEKLQETLPASATTALSCLPGTPIQPWPKLPHLAVKLVDPETFRLHTERSGMFSKVCALSGLAIHGIENYPSVLFAKFEDGEIPATAIGALNDAQPEHFTLAHLSLIPILNSAPKSHHKQ